MSGRGPRDSLPGIRHRKSHGRHSRDRAVREQSVQEELLPGRASIWRPMPAAVYGTFPQGFVAWAASLLDAHPADVVHLCSGMLLGGRLRVDVRRTARPDVVADARRLPLRDGWARAVLIDPPYTPAYADALYRSPFPRPSHLLREAARILRPGGRVGILHFFVPAPRGDLEIAGVWGLTFGTGYRIRAFTVYARPRPAPSLFDGGGE